MTELDRRKPPIEYHLEVCRCQRKDKQFPTSISKWTSTLLRDLSSYAAKMSTRTATLERQQETLAFYAGLYAQQSPLYGLIFGSDISITKSIRAWIWPTLGISTHLRRSRWMPVSQPTRIQLGPYKIEETQLLNSPIQRHPLLFAISNALVWILCMLHLVHQIQLLRAFPSVTTRQAWSLWTASSADVLLCLQELVLGLNVIIPLFLSKHPKIRPRYFLYGKQTPTVDVCVTCCGEPMDIVMNTVAAAAAQDYPAERLRVLVLDDGGDEALRKGVEALGRSLAARKGPQILYRSRAKKGGEKSYYKSGNLHFGISELKKLGQSEYFANLDCDMIPEPDWLRRMLPALIIAPDTGLVNPPQNYYNVPSGDPLAQQTDLDIFFSIYEPLNDALGAARCMGTGFIVRHQALDEIGGWPLIDVGEDFMLSCKLKNAGWKTAFIPEDVQCGLAPESLRAHIKQKQRWVDGALEVHKRFGFYMPWAETRFNYRQKLILLLQTVREYTPLTNLLAMIALPMSLLSILTAGHSNPTNKTWASQALASKYSFLAFYVVSKINQHLPNSQIGSNQLTRLQSRDIWDVPYTATRCLLSLLPSSTHKLIFSPSGAVESPIHERHVNRSAFLQRVFDRSVLWHWLYLLFTSVCLGTVIYRTLCGRSQTSELGVTQLLPGATVKLYSCVWKSAVPLWYLAFPPTVPDWIQLTYDDGNGVRRPKTKGVPRSKCRIEIPWVEATEVGLICLCLLA